jgi:hypothetical protein
LYAENRLQHGSRTPEVKLSGVLFSTDQLKMKFFFSLNLELSAKTVQAKFFFPQTCAFSG